MSRNTIIWIVVAIVVVLLLWWWWAAAADDEIETEVGTEDPVAVETD